MITHNESRIITIVAVDQNGKIISPCGRCRELIYQINPQNSDTRILLRDGGSATLKELLPNHWYMD